jgi:hypothetical protein
VGSWLRRSPEFANNDAAVIDVVNQPGFDAIQANEGQPAYDLLGREQCREAFFIAEAVLKRQDRRLWPNQGRQQSCKLVIRGRFEADESKIARPNFLRHPGAMRLDMEIAPWAPNAYTPLPDDFIVGAQEKMDLLAELAKLCAIETTQGAAADNGDLHLPTE